MADKKVVLAFGLDSKRIDPKFCDHADAYHVIADGDSWWQCYDCGAMIDENGEVVHISPDDIPIFEEDLKRR